MIERHDGKIELTCDGCADNFDGVYDDEDFNVMMADARAAGWKSIKVDGEWEHRCSACKGK